MDIEKAHEEINSIIGLEVEPKENDIMWFPNEESGFEFVYKTDHWEESIDAVKNAHPKPTGE